MKTTPGFPSSYVSANAVTFATAPTRHLAISVTARALAE